MAKIWTPDKTKCWKGCRKQEHSFIAGGMQNDTATLEDGLAVFTKLSMFLPQDPEVVLLVIYTKELKLFFSLVIFQLNDSFLISCYLRNNCLIGLCYERLPSLNY